MIYAQVTETHGQVREPQSRVETTKVNPPPAPAPAPANGPHVATPAEVESLAANAPSPGQQFKVALSPGVASEDRLQVKTIWAARVIEVLFPQIKTIYGYRQDALPWHPNGLAIDVMIPDHNSPRRHRTRQPNRRLRPGERQTVGHQPCHLAAEDLSGPHVR